MVLGTGNKKLADFSNDSWNIAAATLVYLRALQNSPDPEIRRRFEVLNSSPRYHIISVRTTRILKARNWYGDSWETTEGNFVASPLETDSYKMRNGTNIGFAPLDWYLTQKGSIRHSIISLTHEMLGHSYYQELGEKWPNDSLSNRSVKWNEVVAVDIENYMRAMLREEIRINYDGKRIDDSERNIDLPHIGVFPPLMQIQSLPTPANLNKYIQNK
ncbi:hypothetical protein [[Flexibacter] sp. ATCC 35208]|uniref:hypothetical protein n=1 Tax=[Flexibacter] sp. ATCC 35208 TaxID=1936242 RepID=UPI0009CCE88D|nr:hypothetical protein [[Flexibacter] sp. ATCC 35208]OMP76219.1 hypothetical protein BW716_25915 [[Flexibacter] sp. ATCC 35208]